uniref:Uncharacterized protein n=1 Tax=Caenorhabditis japonica TaxID=281687 RepID=A0A8R1DFM9_CAEJA
MSNESRAARQTPTSSGDEETDKNLSSGDKPPDNNFDNKNCQKIVSCNSQLDVAMKLSGISISSSRSSEPRLKKVTFESSTYVISNSFLGEGAGKVLVVRRNSGSAVRRVSTDWSPTRAIESIEGVAGGGEWWNRKVGVEKQVITDNHTNRGIEEKAKGRIRLPFRFSDDRVSGSTNL